MRRIEIESSGEEREGEGRREEGRKKKYEEGRRV